MNLPVLQAHDFKGLLRFYEITQVQVAAGLKISQAALNQELNGVRPMKPKTENYIAKLIEQLRKSRISHSRKIKKA